MTVIVYLVGTAIGLCIGGLFWGWIIMLVAGMLWHETGIGVPFGFFPVGFVLGLVVSLVMFQFTSDNS